MGIACAVVGDMTGNVRALQSGVMEARLKIAFVSNYINHHQIPFCNEMDRLTNGCFTFVQTQPMEAERVCMGWHEEERPGYVKRWYEEESFCRELLMDCDAVLFGGTDDESYIQKRLAAGKLIVRISERLYKTGQWKAVSPRGLRRKYSDHTRYRNAPVYLLCSGAYVPSDFHIVRAYPGKMYCWGYFPETKRYDISELMGQKGWTEEKAPRFLWAGRMIHWKHPELALETAKYLKSRGISFHMDIVGDGELKSHMENMWHSYGLESCVSLLGVQPPEQVRRYMEKADVFLFTSDRQEGWGAVANEAMNSGCALLADHMIGAAPYLVKPGENGFIFRDGRSEELLSLAERLATDEQLCRKVGEKAYNTIIETWNAENAAARLMKLLARLKGLNGVREDMVGADSFSGTGENFRSGCFQGELYPCSPAPILSEWEAMRKVKQIRKKEY